MAPKKISSVLDAISGVLGTKNDAVDVALTKTVDSVMSMAERNKLIKRVAQTPEAGRSTISLSGLMEHTNRLGHDIAANSKENTQIQQIAPEITQARTIVQSSILAPNDLQANNAIPFACQHPGLPVKSQESIAKVISDHFNNTLQLPTNAMRYIGQALYESGSTVLCVVPTSELDRLFNDTSIIGTTATEQLHALEAFGTKIEKTVRAPIFFTPDPAADVAGATEALTVGLEHYQTTLGNGASYDGKRRKPNKDTADMAAKIIGSLEVLDNPDILRSSAVINQKASGSISSRLRTHYKTSPMTSLMVPKDPGKSHPVVIEFPSESVMPLYVPGNPSDHLAYIVTIDERGCPIDLTEQMSNISGDVNSAATIRTQFSDVFQAYGLGRLTGVQMNETKLMSDLYQRVVETHINQKISKLGLQNAELGSDSSVFRVMFQRFLQNRRTTLLFVPKDLMIYMAYKYNKNGTGRSMLEDIKFVLAMRTTLLTCNILQTIDNAVQRQNVTVDLESTHLPIHGDEVLDHVRREIIRKSTPNFTFDPNSITNDVVEKSISISLRGGANESPFQITREKASPSQSTVDSEMLNNLRDMVLHGLYVPPSALNNLSEAEFARSVTTNNILFSQVVRVWQLVTTAFTNQYVRTYTTFSQPLRDAIQQIITNHSGSEEGTNDDQKITVDDVIAYVTIMLPEPIMAPEKAQFEGIDSAIQSIDALLMALIPDELGSLTESSDVVTALRSLYKQKIMGSIVSRFGIGNEITIPDLCNVPVDDLQRVMQSLHNLKQFAEKTKEVLTPKEPEADDGATGDDGSSGFM